MPYEVKTDILDGYDEGAAITQTIYNELITRGCPESWFKPIEQVEEGQYWEVKNDVYRVMKLKGNDWECKNIRTGYNTYPNTYWIESNARKLSIDEIEEALSEERERRGYTPYNFNDLDEPYQEPIERCGDQYQPRDDVLLYANKAVYDQGNWAEIIEDKWEPFRIFWSDKYKIVNEDRTIMGVTGRRISYKEAQTIADALNKKARE